MVEGSFRSVDPLAYYVNTLSDFDPNVVTAYKTKDNDKIKELVSKDRGEIDLFICVNKHWHGFVLCVPTGDPENGLADFSDVINSPFDVPSLQLCWQYELCFEKEIKRMYKIRREVQLFRDIKGKIHRSYFIGKYKGTNANALQFAALRAAPHRYSVLLDDCVEFAKEFCVQALAYCSNWRELEAKVHDNITKATATGFSAEKLSRNVRSSGWFGNTFLAGTDISSLQLGRHSLAAKIVFIVFIVVYPVVVNLLLSKC